MHKGDVIANIDYPEFQLKMACERFIEACKKTNNYIERDLIHEEITGLLDSIFKEPHSDNQINKIYYRHIIRNNAEFERSSIKRLNHLKTKYLCIDIIKYYNKRLRRGLKGQ